MYHHILQLIKKRFLGPGPGTPREKGKKETLLESDIPEGKKDSRRVNLNKIIH